MDTIFFIYFCLDFCRLCHIVWCDIFIWDYQEIWDCGGDDMNGFSRMKIGKQFNIVYVCAVVVPVLALGIFLVLNIYSMLLTHHRDLVHGSNNSSKKIRIFF